jgi:NAD(P)-dependent dehydrogenase (short-subunit alcohol dehydrogenase family)
MIHARRRKRLDAIAAEIAATGGESEAVEADVTNEGQMRHAFDAAADRFGTVTICVNNAGISRPGRLIDGDKAAWSETMAVNLDAVRSVGILAAQRMAAAGRRGAIVNIASIASFGVGRSMASYAVSKAAVMQLTKVMGFEFARLHIRANAIAPDFSSPNSSSDPTKPGHTALRNMIAMGYKGRIFPVNPREPAILDLPCYKNVLDIPEPVETCLLMVS